MTITILIVVFGCLALLLLFYTTRRRAADISQYESLSSRLEPVPVDAILNLIDPAQRDYLERNMPRRDFARLQRLRNRALFGYVRKIQKNAGILMQCAHAAAHSDRPEVAQAGQELLDLALFTRTQSMYCLAVLASSIFFPGNASDLLPTVSKYVTATARSTSLAALLAR
jgi:hypothetical protein